MKKNIYTLLIFLYVVLLSCQQDKNEVTKIDPTKVSADVISKLQQAGYDTSQGLLKYKDGYLVEYDIFFTEEQINNLTNPISASKNGRVEHYRSNNLVTGTPRILKVYTDPAFGPNMLNACNTALARYNALSLGLAFQSVATAAGADISIISFYEVTTILGYSAFPSGGNPPSTIRLNSYHYNASSTPPSAAGTIAHEIGHAIGFAHTDYMNISFSCGKGGNTGGEAVYIPGTPSGPSANSFMLACTDGVDRPFTAEDVTALTTVYGSQWQLLPGAAYDIGVGADGSVFMVGASGIYQWNGSGWNALPGGAVRVAVGPTGIPWVVNSAGSIYRKNGNDWDILPGSAIDIGVGADGSVFMISTGNGIYQWNGSGWTALSGGASRIAVGPTGIPWVINSAGNIYRRNGSGWDLLPGLAKDIGIGANGSVFVVNSTKNIYQWTGSGWNGIPGGGTNVSVDPAGKPWLVNGAFNIFRWQ